MSFFRSDRQGVVTTLISFTCMTKTYWLGQFGI